MGMTNLKDAKTVVSGRDYALLIDASASMGARDCPGGLSRWDYATNDIAMAIANIADQYDDDGIDVIFFGNKGGAIIERNVPASRLSEITPPSANHAATYIWEGLDDEFKRYFEGGAAKPITYIVLTDGQASDENRLKTAIMNAAKAAGDGDQIAVAFWQVGNDSNATKYLESLDNDLGEIDICDTKPMEYIVENLGQLEIPLADAVVD